MLTPLQRPGEAFQLSLRNPNPRSSKGKEGPTYRISFEVSQDDFLMFMDADTSGMVLECAAVVVGGTGAEPPPPPAVRKGPYGTHARDLRLSNVLGSEMFARHIGTDAEYHAWVQRQPSCVSQAFGEYLADGPNAGEGRNEAAHIRRAGAAGTAYKPAYWQIPLTHDEHQYQHQHGELALLHRAGIVDPVADANPTLIAAEWFDEQVFRHRSAWGWETLKAKLGYASWTDVPPGALRDWCAARGDDRLLRMLPACYRDA